MTATRLSPGHFEASPLPPEVAAYSSTLQTLPPGAAAGKVAILDLELGPINGRTELQRHFQKSPLQVMRPLYFDPERPDMAIIIAMSAGAGMLQGDRFRIDATCESGSALHLTTQGATKVMRMDGDYATSLVNLTAGSDCLIEYLPDPIIPCVGSRSYHRTRLEIGPGTTAIVGETLRAGRVGHGERHVYDVLATDFEVCRPGRAPLVVDRVRLAPGASEGIAGPGMLSGEDQMATLHVVSEAAPAEEIVRALREAMEPASGIRWGVSSLPGECGAWVRILGSHSPDVDRAMVTSWDTARRLLVGVPAPNMRKSRTFVN